LNSRLLRKLASAVLAILLLVYVGYQIYNMHHTKILTETAENFTASETVQAEGVAVRAEVPVKADADGVIDYVLNTGDKVDKGGTVALVYANEQQAGACRELGNVDLEIQKLQNLQTPGNTYAASPDTVNSLISRELSGLLSKTVDGDFYGLSEERENLLYLVNERQVVTGQISSFGARIKALQARKNALTAQAGSAKASIFSPASGYFIQSAENVSELDYNGALSLTSAQIRSAEKASAAPMSGAVGKICTNYNWYFACVVPASNAAAFRSLTSGGTVTVGFPFVSNETAPATVAAVNQTGENSEAAVILECDYMNSALASLGRETAQIVVQEYSGIRVSRNTVHFQTVSKDVRGADGKTTVQKKEVMGVYVVNGSMLQFRQIVPEYSTDAYVICDPSPSKEDLMTSDTVKLHDEVVVEGTDLYDGKVIE
jgi:hypothetical protein